MEPYFKSDSGIIIPVKSNVVYGETFAVSVPLPGTHGASLQDAKVSLIHPHVNFASMDFKGEWTAEVHLAMQPKADRSNMSPVEIILPAGSSVTDIITKIEGSLSRSNRRLTTDLAVDFAYNWEDKLVSTTSGFLRLETDNPELWTLLGYTDEQYVQAGRTKRQDESEEDDEVFEEALGKPDETVDDGAGRSVLPSDVTIATQSGDGEQGEGGETGGDNQAAPPTTSRPQPPPSASAPSSSTSATTWYMLADETAEYPPNPRARLNNRAALRIVPSDIHEMLHVARMSMSVENADRNRILELLDELVGELSEPLNTFYTPNDNLRRIPLTFSYSPEGELIFKADNQGATVGIRSIRIHNGDTPVRLPNHVEFARAVNRRVNTKVVPLVFDYGYAIVMENGLGMALASGDSGEQCALGEAVLALKPKRASAPQSFPAFVQTGVPLGGLKLCLRGLGLEEGVTNARADLETYLHVCAN